MISDEISKYKSWSNLKKKMHDLLCDSLKDKISYFYTSYHEVHNAYGRATINYCKKEIVAFSWLKCTNKNKRYLNFTKREKRFPTRNWKKENGCLNVNCVMLISLTP